MVEAVEDEESVRYRRIPIPVASIHQFIKFCIIGFSSFAIDFAILNLLMARFGMNWIAASTISFSVAVSNGFIWNSLWTFRGVGSSKRHEQYIKFVAVNIVGYCLNILIMGVILYALTGEIVRIGPGAIHSHISRLNVNASKMIAVVFVSTWNFWASKKWTFK